MTPKSGGFSLLEVFIWTFCTVLSRSSFQTKCSLSAPKRPAPILQVRYLPEVGMVLLYAGATQPQLHHCKRYGNILVCWCCPAPQKAPVWTLWSDESGALLGGKERKQGCPAACLAKGARRGGFRVLEHEHQEISLCSRTEEKDNKSTANNPQPNLS